MVRYPKWMFALVPGLIVLHLNYWMWDDARLVFGLPVNLLYHIVLCVSLGFIMRGVVKRAWPVYLDDDG